MTGQARVILKNGNVYTGHAVYDGRTVTIKGRLEVTSIVNGKTTHRYQRARRLTVPLHRVHEIKWDDDNVRRAVEHVGNSPERQERMF